MNIGISLSADFYIGRSLVEVPLARARRPRNQESRVRCRRWGGPRRAPTTGAASDYRILWESDNFVNLFQIMHPFCMELHLQRDSEWSPWLGFGKHHCPSLLSQILNSPRIRRVRPWLGFGKHHCPSLLPQILNSPRMAYTPGPPFAIQCWYTGSSGVQSRWSTSMSWSCRGRPGGSPQSGTRHPRPQWRCHLGLDIRRVINNFSRNFLFDLEYSMYLESMYLETRFRLTLHFDRSFSNLFNPLTVGVFCWAGPIWKLALNGNRDEDAMTRICDPHCN